LNEKLPLQTVMI